MKDDVTADDVRKALRLHLWDASFTLMGNGADGYTIYFKDEAELTMLDLNSLASCFGTLGIRLRYTPEEFAGSPESPLTHERRYVASTLTIEARDDE